MNVHSVKCQSLEFHLLPLLPPFLFRESRLVLLVHIFLTSMQCLQCILESTKRKPLRGKVKTDCNCSFLTTHFFVLWILLLFVELLSLTAHFTIPYRAVTSLQSAMASFFSYLLDSQQQMLVILLKCVKAESHLVRITLEVQCKSSAYIPIVCSLFVPFVCAVETKMLSDIYQRYILYFICI